MEPPIFAQGGSRAGTGSRLVLGGILALLLLLGMAAMHGIHAGTATASQGSTADTSAMHAAAPVLVADSGTHAAPGASCANCSPDELSMAANCMAAVVLGFLLALPGLRTGRPWLAARAGPQRSARQQKLGRAPSLHELCINRC